MKLPAPINWKASPHAIGMYHFWAGTIFALRTLPPEDKQTERHVIREWAALARKHYERATGEDFI